VKAAAGRLRTLVVVNGPLDDFLTGPELRGWEVARQLATHQEVTVMAHVTEPEHRDGMLVTP
jgi:hypothetical protein